MWAWEPWMLQLVSIRGFHTFSANLFMGWIVLLCHGILSKTVCGYRWWGPNNWIYGKCEHNGFQHSSSERHICIWSCNASISLKLSLKRMVSWSWLLSCCENWHCTICMCDLHKLRICTKLPSLAPTIGKKDSWLSCSSLIYIPDDIEDDLCIAGNDPSVFWCLWRGEVWMELWVRYNTCLGIVHVWLCISIT